MKGSRLTKYFAIILVTMITVGTLGVALTSTVFALTASQAEKQVAAAMKIQDEKERNAALLRLAGDPVDNVGVMSGVSAVCYVQGTCTLCDILVVFITIANSILRLVAIVGVIFLVLGAGFIMLSQGNAERLTKGKKILKASIVGSLIVLGAWQIMSMVMLVLANKNIFEPEGVKLPYNPITGWFKVADQCAGGGSAASGGSTGGGTVPTQGSGGSF